MNTNMLDLILDSREHKLIEMFPNTKTQQLDIGDIHLLNTDDETIKYIIERKTLDDLSSSIIDGRYKEQKCRLLASGYQIIYVIEGMTKNKHGVKYATLLSAMLNIQFRDKIQVIRTKDIHETANILVLLKEKLKNCEIESTKQIKYVTDIHISKKQNLTKENIFIKQLSCIPGVSSKIATDISKKYTNLSELLNGFNNIGPNFLTSIDGIGNIISSRIYNNLI